MHEDATAHSDGSLTGGGKQHRDDVSGRAAMVNARRVIKVFKEQAEAVDHA